MVNSQQSQERGKKVEKKRKIVIRFSVRILQDTFTLGTQEAVILF